MASEAHKKSARTTKMLHGDDFHAKAGKKGGEAKNPNKGYGSMTPEQKAIFYKRRSENRKKS